MSKLSNLDVFRTIVEFENDNPQIELTAGQEQDIFDLFDRLMNEEVNKSKNQWEQEALITDIAIGYSIGEPTDLIFRQHADNKHLNFFDNFLEYGETSKIEKLLKENNLPSSVLKGLKPNQEIHLVQEYKGNKIEIKGNITFSPDGEKEQNDYLEISMNGQTIYSWERNAIDENVMLDDIDFEPDEYYRPEPKVEALKEQPKRKDGKPRKSTYVGTVISADAIIVEESYHRLGRRRLQYAAGTVIDGVKVGGRTVKQK